MPATTPRLALPYPVPADTVDVPRDMQALADKLEGITGIAPPLVSALPGSPVDGQECYYQSAAMAALGIVWHLRYRAGGGTFKWECVGAPALLGEVVTSEQRAATGYGDLATVGPDVTVPLAGEYMVEAGFTFNAATAMVAYMSYSRGGTAAQDATATHGTVSMAAVTGSFMRTVSPLTLAAGDLLRGKYRGSTTDNVVYQNRWLRVTPRRVG